jgi:hypothetical protein
MCKWFRGVAGEGGILLLPSIGGKVMLLFGGFLPTLRPFHEKSLLIPEVTFVYNIFHYPVTFTFISYMHAARMI